MSSIAEQIAQELNVKTTQVNTAITLLDDGATVPFIARYRKEATQGLDDNHLRELATRLTYLRDVEARRQVILTSIKQQDKLTAELAKQIANADNKTRLEDLYLPYKPKRRTKGQIAIEAGIEPLANSLFNHWQLNPEQEAQAYLDKRVTIEAGFSDVKTVLEGASSILAERFSEDANLLQKLRNHILKQAHLTSKVVKGKEKEAGKFRDYFDHSEKLKTVPSHRMLAMLRGRNEGFLQLKINVDPSQEKNTVSSAEQIISEHLTLRCVLQGKQQNAADFLTNTVRLAWKSKLSVSLSTELLGRLREQAEQQAIKVFATNLADLLMAAPAGAKVTLGLDPGLRTGCKIAIVDATGKLLHTTTIFPHAPQNHWDKSVRTLVNICRQHKVELIAIGNGTGSRESDQLASEVIAQFETDKPKKIVVSEAGASVYSASEFAAKEFPDLDVSLRGAVSIARRLQDPLAELVKIDPKAIGVGQYQHDVSQSQLSQGLDDVVEDCVNAVGVDLNSASAALLTRVAGLTKAMASNIVQFRDEQGAFTDRKQLKKVARLGPKAFEQAAGFLRITGGDNPLDQCGVHPETYSIVENIIKQLGLDTASLLNNAAQLQQVNINDLVTTQFGEVTIKAVIQELAKPNRDPRPEFKTATFADGVNNISDLEVGMVLEGVVSNVANFGAFVDVGVHQDGLVHISAITDKFISDPREVIKAGEVVKVKVVEVDAARKRISLTMRLDDSVDGHVDKSANKSSSTSKHKSDHKGEQKKTASDKSQDTNQKQSSQRNSSQRKPHKAKPQKVENAAMGNAFADAFAKLKK